MAVKDHTPCKGWSCLFSLSLSNFKVNAYFAQNREKNINNNTDLQNYGMVFVVKLSWLMFHLFDELA